MTKERLNPAFIEVIAEGKMKILIQLGAIKYVRPYGDQMSIIVLVGESDDDQQTILEPYQVVVDRIMKLVGQK